MANSSRHLPRFVLPAFLVLITLLSACGKDPAEQRQSTAAPYTDLNASLTEAQQEATQLVGPKGEEHRAAWDLTDGSAAWTSTVLDEVRSNRSALESAEDMEDFCPGYSRATSFQKETCWLRIVSGMAKYESRFRPEATYLETWGLTSVGLLMMNPDHCPAASSIELLKVAESNIRCAMPRMSSLVQRYRLISGTDTKSSALKYTGAAAYWQVLRPPHLQGNLLLGRKPHIQIFTRSYAAFAER